LDTWNSLPATIINCGTLELFTNRIHCFFKDREFIKAPWASFLCIYVELLSWVEFFWGQTNRRWDRDAEGIEGEEYWGGGSPPHLTRGLGERRELPQLGPGRSQGAKRIWCILMLSGGHWLQRFTKFCSVSSNKELCKLHKHIQHT